MKINNREFKVWLSHLYAETYTKGRHYLQVGNSYCCLGVGCKLFISTSMQFLRGVELQGRIPSEQRHSPKWLKQINKDFSRKTGVALAALNDGTESALFKEYTHPEIAMLLQLVYIHKILD